LPPKADSGLAKENERLRKENRLLTEERELLKKATVFFAPYRLLLCNHLSGEKSKQMRFAFVENIPNGFQLTDCADCCGSHHAASELGGTAR
jgi:hypothetical protein